jgi:hypothetical protein
MLMEKWILGNLNQRYLLVAFHRVAAITSHAMRIRVPLGTLRGKMTHPQEAHISNGSRGTQSGPGPNLV